MNNIKVLFLLGFTLVTSSTHATIDSLPELMHQDVGIRPYVKSLITSSTLDEQAQLLSAVESPTTFSRLNFNQLVQGIFDDNAWRPHAHEFKDNNLKLLFSPYFSKLSPSDAHLIFLANVLYDVGSRIYSHSHNYNYLERAASIGHDGALYKMFLVAYDEGKLEAAKNYLLCSGAQGNQSALLTLAEVFEGYKNIGLPKNFLMAKLLCQEAASLGSQEAQFNLQVATLTEGTYGFERNFQQGIRNAKQLADSGNQQAIKFLNAIMESSGDALLEGSSSITYEDLDFLRSFLNWKDEFDE